MTLPPLAAFWIYPATSLEWLESFIVAGQDKKKNYDIFGNILFAAILLL